MLSVVPLHNVHNMTIHRVYLKELFPETEAWPSKESQRLVEGICSCECAENMQTHLKDKYMPILGVENGKIKHLQVKALSLLETR